MTNYRSIVVKNGNGGYGGPLTIKPTNKIHKFMYLTTGGDKSDVVEKIAKLTGMEAVNGFQNKIQEEEIAMVVIDCGGTLRCGVYPIKGIPTINLEATGRSGPFGKCMTEDIYVSGVNIDGLSTAEK